MRDAPFRMLIDGRLEGATDEYEVIDPATRNAFAKAPKCSEEQLDRTVQAAANAFTSWSRTSSRERKTALIKMADAIEASAEQIAETLTREQGKPLSDARGELALTVAKFRETAALELQDQLIETAPNRRVRLSHTPLGVVAAIAPWNYPITLAAQKVAAAIYTGNCVILKPSPYTPLSTLLLGEIVRECVPPGVLNVLSGDDRLGPWMTSHPGIAKVSFTGSVATGKRVMQSAAATLKRVTLELGGNDAAVVFPGVDIEDVASRVFWTAFLNAGQICIAAKRIFVHESIYGEFFAALCRYAAGVHVGPGSDPKSQIGPIQNLNQYNRVQELIADCRKNKFELVVAGAAPEGVGYFLPITLVDNPPDSARIVAEEQFGPIAPVLKFESENEVLSRINSTEFGLGATVWTGDPEQAVRVAAAIDAGNVWVNEDRSVSPLAPFGGHKQSGLGAEGGLEGLYQYTNAKVVTEPIQQAAAAKVVVLEDVAP
jgi:aldehyde dehydrogenase (NAD+)